jgi:3-hydroxyacyl-[acyl-carrier-protein] dehydratase
LVCGEDSPNSEANLTTPCTLPPADINEILKHIPHRYPFLLIDRMEACEPNKWVRVVKNVSNNDWFFAGVPAGRRVMPQMLVLEALAQAAGVLCHFSGLTAGMSRLIIFFAGIESARFHGDALPGDRIVFECLLKRALRGVVKLKGKAAVNNNAIVETELTAVIRDMADAPKVLNRGKSK